MSSVDIKEKIRELIAGQGLVRNGDVVQSTGVSRQAVYQHFRQMLDAGELVQVGQKRGTYYKFSPEVQATKATTRAATSVDAPPQSSASTHSLTRALQGLAEDRVWDELCRSNRELKTLSEPAHNILHYAVTELVNNAIDHSRGKRVEVRTRLDGGNFILEIQDDGIGVYENLQKILGLDSRLTALQELSKGKQTTQPERHTGEGIFFTSKAGDRFELESNGLVWKIDNLRNDTAVEMVSSKPGTRVQLHIASQSQRSLRNLFEQYTENHEFTRTRTVIKLFAIGTTFVSRSEAKRLLLGLDKFKEVILDFAGVQTVGQGFADEVFRVWARSHPKTKLVATNMSEGVEFMLLRAGYTSRARPNLPRG